MSDCCSIGFELIVKAEGRTDTIYLSGFNTSSALGSSYFTQEIKDRRYRYTNTRHVRDLDAKPLHPVGDAPFIFTRVSINADMTTINERNFPACASNSAFNIADHFGTATRIDWIYNRYKDCDDIFHRFEDLKTTRLYEPYMDGDTPFSPMTKTIVDETYIKTFDPCLITPDTDTTVTVEESYWNPTADFGGAVVTVEADASLRTTYNDVDGETGYTIMSLTDWITYAYALGLYTEVLDQAAICTPTETVFAQDVPDTPSYLVDGREFGICGAKTVDSGLMLSQYIIPFDETYEDMDHKIDRVEIIQRSSFDVIIRMNEDLGKPTVLRVLGDVMYRSQDTEIDDVVEVSFDEELSLVGADTDYDSGDNKAWNYGTPAALSPYLDPPTEGGWYYLRNTRVQLVPGGYFSAW